MSGMQKMNMEEMEVVKGGFNSSVYKAEFSCPSSVADFKKNIIVTVLRKRKDILSSVMKTVVCNLVIS